jgi:hypothetical protein
MILPFFRNRDSAPALLLKISNDEILKTAENINLQPLKKFEFIVYLTLIGVSSDYADLSMNKYSTPPSS